MGNRRLFVLLFICSSILLAFIPTTSAQKLSEEEPLEEGSAGLNNPDDEDYAESGLPPDGTHDEGHVPAQPVQESSLTTTTTTTGRVTTTEADSDNTFETVPTNSGTSSESAFNTTYLIIGIVAFLILLVTLILIFMCCCRKSRENNTDYRQGIVRTKEYV